MRCFALFLALSAAVFAQTPPAKTQQAQVEAAEKAVSQAVTAKDAAALRLLLADDLIYTHSTGLIETKAEFLRKLEDGTQTYHAIQHEDIQVRVNGNSAAVAMGAWYDTETKGQARAKNHLRILRYYVKRGGKWRLVAHQSARLPN
jgi:ketosteroid isomerase-like protein